MTPLSWKDTDEYIMKYAFVAIVKYISKRGIITLIQDPRPSYLLPLR